MTMPALADDMTSSVIFADSLGVRQSAFDAKSAFNEGAFQESHSGAGRQEETAMPTVSISLNGRSYDVACGVGEEDRVRDLADRIRRRMDQLSKSVGAVPENLLFTLTALLLADELDQREREVAQLQQERQNLADGREAQLANSLETLATKIEAIAARLQAA